MAPKKRRFCPHCEENVSVRTYRDHFELYFDKEKDEWQKVQSSDEDDSFSQAETRCHLRDACSGMAMDEADGEEGEIYHSETTDKHTQSAHGKCILDKNVILTAKLTKCFHCYAMEK